MDFIVLRRQHNMLLAHFYGDLSDNTLTSIDTRNKAIEFIRSNKLSFSDEFSEHVDARLLFFRVFCVQNYSFTTTLYRYLKVCNIEQGEYYLLKSGRNKEYYISMDTAWRFILYYRKLNLVYGYGINDDESPVKVKGKLLMSYRKWCGMLERCYSDKWHIKKPTYKHCQVSADWKYYSNFKRWFNINYINGYVLDKDLLLKGNKVYSKDTCLLMPERLNGLLINRTHDRGNYPVGVTLRKERKSNVFEAAMMLNGKRKHLGFFDTPVDAFIAYKKGKEAYIQTVAKEYLDKALISMQIYNALMAYEVSESD
jgi:hypothetical protein